MAKTGAGLAAYAIAQLGRPYWWGTYGQVASQALLNAKRQQYPDSYRGSQYASQFGQKVHDCVGLIKGYLWCDDPDGLPRYEASQDVAVAGLWAQCSLRGELESIPEIPGVCVFNASLGHVGVYIGKGEVVEAMGQDYGVVKTRLHARNWTRWGMPRWIDYEGQEGTFLSPGGGGPEGEYELVIEDEPKPEWITQKVELPILRRDCYGAPVQNAQLLLIGHGYYCGGKKTLGRETPDGDFGEKTEKAVRAFQKLFGLEVDGEIGCQTWAALIMR